MLDQCPCCGQLSKNIVNVCPACLSCPRDNCLRKTPESEEDRLLNEYDGVMVCPNCGSHAITATRDASFAFSQRQEGDKIIREKGYVSLFDNMLDAECLDCHTTSGTNGDGPGDGPGDEWWED